MLRIGPISPLCLYIVLCYKWKNKMHVIFKYFMTLFYFPKYTSKKNPLILTRFFVRVGPGISEHILSRVG